MEYFRILQNETDFGKDTLSSDINKGAKYGKGIEYTKPNHNK